MIDILLQIIDLIVQQLNLAPQEIFPVQQIQESALLDNRQVGDTGGIHVPNCVLQGLSGFGHNQLCRHYLLQRNMLNPGFLRRCIHLSQNITTAHDSLDLISFYYNDRRCPLIGHNPQRITKAGLRGQC